MASSKIRRSGGESGLFGCSGGIVPVGRFGFSSFIFFPLRFLANRTLEILSYGKESRSSGLRRLLWFRSKYFFKVGEILNRFETEFKGGGGCGAGVGGTNITHAGL